MLSAGTNVEWLRDDLGLIADRGRVPRRGARSARHRAASCTCPPCSASAPPQWDYGARGTLLGITRGTGRPHVVRAVLEGVAQRGADLVEAAEADGGVADPALRVDGGMSANPTFVQALADATQRPVEVSPVLEATTLGAAFLAGLAIGTWADEDEVRRHVVAAPDRRARGRHRPRPMGSRRCDGLARGYPELSGIDF